MSDKLENSIKELMKNRQSGRKDISSIPPPPDDAGTRALGEALDSSFKIVKLIIVGLVVAFIYSLTFSIISIIKSTVIYITILIFKNIKRVFMVSQ